MDRQFYRGHRAGLEIDRGPCQFFVCCHGPRFVLDLLLLLGPDARSYMEAFAKCEIEWISKLGMSPKAQNQTGARHSPEAHIHSLQKWLALVPAILPSAPFCDPTLLHPDLSGGNILVAGDSSNLAVSGIIDWQGASIRPMFDFIPPPFLMTKPEKVRKLHVNAQGAADNDTPSADILDGQQAVTSRFLRILSELSPSLHQSMSSPHLEKLQDAKYYSAHSWSDGLPLLDVALISIYESYGDDIPLHPDHPHCPASFNDEERLKVLKDLPFHHQEAMLENYARQYLQHSGIIWQEDGSVPPDRFEEAQRAITELYARAVKSMAAEQHEVDAFNQAWPYRKGKFTLTADVCT